MDVLTMYFINVHAGHYDMGLSVQEHWSWCEDISVSMTRDIMTWVSQYKNIGPDVRTYQFLWQGTLWHGSLSTRTLVLMWGHSSFHDKGHYDMGLSVQEHWSWCGDISVSMTRDIMTWVSQYKNIGPDVRTYQFLWQGTLWHGSLSTRTLVLMWGHISFYDKGHLNAISVNLNYWPTIMFLELI